MDTDFDNQKLVGKLLVSMPNMADSRFDNSVILMIHHNEESSMGVVVNKVAGLMQIGTLSKENKKIDADSDPLPVYFGGPVDCERATILHSNDVPEYSATIAIGEHFCVTACPDILEDYSRGSGPNHMIIALGYAGWGPGQLEDELKQNSWLICDAGAGLVFDTEDNQKWDSALKSMGIRPSMLSAIGGSA